jgi:type II secretory pathway pseudopilin PulG
MQDPLTPEAGERGQRREFGPAQELERGQGRRRSGITLIELVVSVTVSAMLVLGLGSALTISARSIRPTANASATLRASKCIRQLQDDLRFATAILEYSPGSVRIITTDADTDGEPDVVAWNWSYESGAPLTRQVNGGTAVPACDGVTDFGLDFIAQNITVGMPTPPIAAAAVTLDAYRPSSGTTAVSVGYYDDYGQFISPEQFPTATRLTPEQQWQPTQIQVFLSATGSTGASTARIALRTATSDGLPTNETLYETTVDPNSFPVGGRWETLDLPDMPWLNADDGLCLTLAWRSGTRRLLAYFAPRSTGGFTASEVTNGEWMRPAPNDCLAYQIDGRVRTKRHRTTTQTRRRLRVADIRLETNETPGAPLYAASELLNRPWDHVRHANTEFDQDPTSEDRNADGVADWVMSTIGGSDRSTIASGLWTAFNRALTLSSLLRSGQTVDVHVRMRATQASGSGAVIHTAVSGSTDRQRLAIRMRLQKQSAGHQRLLVERESSENQFDRLTELKMLDGALLDLRMTLDPEQKLMSLWINAVPTCTLHVPFSTNSSITSTVVVAADDTNCEFDFIEVTQY